MSRITESSSSYRHLETWSTTALVETMNQEDRSVAEAVSKAIPAIGALVDVLVENMEKGGRLFYIGAGTSGRLGILDASECPPTFGVPDTWVTGLIAGGDQAIRKAVEGAEDSTTQAILDLELAGLQSLDVVIGIAASGTTPYVIHGLRACREKGILTGCITCNPGAPIQEEADYPIVVVTGPEFISGSTRLKAGTAQKMVLNMISTATMIRLGRILDNKMVDMKLTNTKLMQRGVQILVETYGISPQDAAARLQELGSVREVMKALKE